MMIHSKNIPSAEDFALLGNGQIAYLKKMNTDTLIKNFPDLPPLTPGIAVWGLFGATGVPIILSNVRATAIEGAFENDLETVTLH